MKQPDNDTALFNYRVRKYLYEINTHPAMQHYHAKAVAFITQTKQFKNHQAHILQYLQDIVSKQNISRSERLRSPIRTDKKEYTVQVTPFNQLPAAPHIDQYLNKFSWVSGGNTCHLNDKQKQDLALIFQKRYAILNWQQGSGKTAAGYAWSKYVHSRKTFVLSTSLSVTITWQNFLKENNEPYVLIKKISDFKKIQASAYVLLSHDFLIRYERMVKTTVRHLGYKIGLIVDESDELTNGGSKRTQATLNCFRKVKYKILTTGTTTRNGIAELYPQLELLYNNSRAMMCNVKTIYIEDKKKLLTQTRNKDYNRPFPARYGATLFKRCFNPARSSMFTLNKAQDQVYNQAELREILNYTMITRKFRDLAGDKYEVITEMIEQNPWERFVYRSIMKEFPKMVNLYYTSTGSDKKDATLKMLRQIQLLIRATSTPQKFHEYNTTKPSNKAMHIFNKIQEIDNECTNCKICIGTITIDALEYYRDEITVRFPQRPVFVIDGSVNFKKRGDIITRFESNTNGILICTQQSLKSSVNIPECNYCIIEALQWNIPKIEQFYFRFIRYNSTGHTKIFFVCYNDTIEANLLVLLMHKEKQNDFVKTLEYRDNKDIYSEFNIDTSILDMMIQKKEDENGKIQLTIDKIK